MPGAQPALSGLLTKQQALDALHWMAKRKIPLRGIEVLRMVNGETETNLYKSTWFASQRGVYRQAKTFIMRQMGGEWLWCELKADITQ